MRYNGILYTTFVIFLVTLKLFKNKKGMEKCLIAKVALSFTSGISHLW